MLCPSAHHKKKCAVHGLNRHLPVVFDPWYREPVGQYQLARLPMGTNDDILYSWYLSDSVSSMILDSIFTFIL